QAGKRVPAAQKVPIEESVVFSPERSTELLALDEALTRLARLSPRQSQVVELRFFGGLNVEDTAQALGVSPKTVKRDWSLARAWQHGEVNSPHDAGTMGASRRSHPA